ncbi:Protein CBG26408 [Caenorhabditis briggsae]|uniref:Uncharacterized protein n=2 Tax=Caenorhabditis briggsae TaxID=6238 RepID=A0AAE9AG71_CAEBR|nr:Protein CBG26408 [Caenorhabditis briggsae]ULT94439.1 hypothetical protein L3Y34_003724 [Caenorhabditis briggsae]CAS00721.1 Protein CBG26408 [Caenorhabditis briggsae]
MSAPPNHPNDMDSLAESLKNIEISCMPVQQRVNLGEQDPNFRREERLVPYEIQVCHVDYRDFFIQVNIDKHSFVLKQTLDGNVQVRVSDGAGQIQTFPMPIGMSMDESLKKITDYFLGRPGTIIHQLLISSEDVLEKCIVPEVIQTRYICYDGRNLDKALRVKCKETFVFAKCFRVEMIRSVFEQVKSLNYTAGMAIEIGTGGIEQKIFPRALETLQDLQPKLGVQPKHQCYDGECDRPAIEHATHLQCLVFDIEDKDLEMIVCLPDFVRIFGAEDQGLNHVVRFRVEPKGTAARCDAENWLSVFDVDGFESYVNMAN